MNRKNLLNKIDIFDSKEISFRDYLGIFLFVFVIWGITVNFGLSFFGDSSIVYNESGKYINELGIGSLLGGKGTEEFRIGTSLSFSLNKILAPYQPFIFHLTNVLIHALSVCFILHILKLWEISRFKALIWAAIAASHPLMTNSIAWIPARAELLLGLFFIIAFVFLIYYLKSRNLIYWISSMIFQIFAFLSNDTGIVIPLVLLSYIILINKKQIKKSLPFCISTVANYFIFYFINRYLDIHYSAVFHFKNAYIFDKIRIFPEMFLKVYFPFALSPMPVFDTLIISIGCLIFVLFLFLLWRNRDKAEIQFISFGIIILFLGLLPFFITLKKNDGIDYFESLTYFPLFGILIVSVFLEKAEPWLNKNKYGLIFGLILGMIGSFSNVNTYSNPETYFLKSLHHNPNSISINRKLADYYFSVNKFNKSLDLYEKLIEFEPENDELISKCVYICNKISDSNRKTRILFKVDSLIKAESEMIKSNYK
ncbi:MAG: hypothetical protein NT007_17030 [Candidatus Kapabacteria bacterium]|nr:hypothetical protein [Candidatus Kapabacteria bacterium]